MKYALATAFLALAPLAARADEVMFRGQKIEYGGAELQWVGEVGSGFEELLLIYRDPAAVGQYFKPSVNCEARVLLVGGGGAGGTVRSSSYTGHPGGGGAGKHKHKRKGVFM